MMKQTFEIQFSGRYYSETTFSYNKDALKTTAEKAIEALKTFLPYINASIYKVGNPKIVELNCYLARVRCDIFGTIYIDVEGDNWPNLIQVANNKALNILQPIVRYCNCATSDFRITLKAEKYDIRLDQPVASQTVYGACQQIA